jgi:lipoate---protein ligase
VVAPSWRVAVVRGRAAEVHARPMAVDRAVEIVEVERPALVLGSTQPASDADEEAAARVGVDVARRRSGGGAVLVLPDRTTWIDVTIPRADRLWEDDVARAFHWVGETWVAALDRLGVVAGVHTGRAVETPWSRRVCFAGIGAGEVVASERKAVGISQRRTRAAARFQCAVHRSWDPAALLGLLTLDDVERADGLLALTGVATGVDRPVDAVVDAFLLSLPPP